MALNSVIESMFLLKKKIAELTMLASLVRPSHWGQHTCGSPPPPLQDPGSARADPMLSYINSGGAASSWFL